MKHRIEIDLERENVPVGGRDKCSISVNGEKIIEVYGVGAIDNLREFRHFEEWLSPLLVKKRNEGG